MFQTALSLVTTGLLAVLIVLLLKFKRDIPDVQQILDDVGESIGEQLTGVFEKPQVSRAMSVLGKKSGEVRADNALRNKAAGVVMEQMPGLGMVLQQFGLTPLEGVKLLNDPIFGPLIRQGLGAAQKALGGGLSGFGGSNSASSSDVFKVT